MGSITAELSYIFLGLGPTVIVYLFTFGSIYACGILYTK